MAMKLSDPIHEPIQQPLRPGIDWDALSDDEIIAAMSRDDERDKYAVAHLEPDGIKYQWVRCEVFGRPDFNRPAEMEQKGWRPVPTERHPGHFAPPGATGPAELDGMRLYELPARVVKLKREVSARAARAKVQDMNDQLIYSPPGTGPRAPTKDHSRAVRHESGSMEMVVE